MVLELIQSRFKGLNLNTERMKLSRVGVDLPRILIIENTNLITEDSDSLLDLGEISGHCFRTTLLTPVDLVNTGGDGDETGHRKND
jgi:hypothetical protein